MDREPVPEASATWSFVVIPHGGAGAVREYTLTGLQLGMLRWIILGNLVVMLGLILTVGLMLPRSLAYDSLVGENLSLKGHLRDVDERMNEVDRLLLPLRLYDAQLDGLASPQGPHGGPDLDPGEIRLANEGFVDAADFLSSVAPATEFVEGDTDAPVEIDEWADDLAPADDDLRPAEAWATSVEHRAESFLEVFQSTEPDLVRMVVALEDLRAIDAALPHIWPARGLLSSGFGWRKNPFMRSRWKFHSGIDVANEPGTPIRAAAAGIVIYAAYNSGYGNHVIIDHGYGITTLYGHCRKLLVHEGDTVQVGDLIGLMGSTGSSTGPHLHFEVHIDGNAVDPLDYLSIRGARSAGTP